MKHFFTFLTLVSSLLAFCQAPDAMSYQAVIRDASNELVSNQSVGMQISILQGSANGTSVYTETQNPTTNTNGLVSIAIGEGSTNDDFSNIDWSEGPYFIKTEIDPNGGSDYSIVGTSQLMSVPYAIYAKKVMSVFSGDYDSLSNIPTIATIPSNLSYFNNDVGYVITLNDDDSTNELQELSVSNLLDTLYLSKGNYVIIPGISAENTEGGGYESNDIIDIDGNSYTSVIIGEQEWMGENLRASNYNDGTSIAEVTDGETWGNLSIPAWCSLLNNANYDSLRGKFYNWYAVADSNSKNICPIGWRVPNDYDWSKLTDYLSVSTEVQGLYLKSESGWQNKGNDYYGFKAIPTGYRYSTGGSFYDYYGSRSVTYFWSTGPITENSWRWSLTENDYGFSNEQIPRNMGNSVRCIKNSEPDITTSFHSSTNSDTSAVYLVNILSDQGTFISASGMVWDTVSNPTVERNIGITEENVSSGYFMSNIEDLEKSSKYYFRAYATNSIGTGYSMEDTLISTRDIDGNSFNTVVIGRQEWMAENLKVTKYNDGTPIVGGATWNVVGNIEKNICPVGWHIPSREEWSLLYEYYLSLKGHDGTQGAVLKSNEGWSNGSDLYGFNAKKPIDASDIKFWSSTIVENSTTAAWGVKLSNTNDIVEPAVFIIHNIHDGGHIRCLRD